MSGESRHGGLLDPIQSPSQTRLEMAWVGTSLCDAIRCLGRARFRSHPMQTRQTLALLFFGSSVIIVGTPQVRGGWMLSDRKSTATATATMEGCTSVQPFRVLSATCEHLCSSGKMTVSRPAFNSRSHDLPEQAQPQSIELHISSSRFRDLIWTLSSWAARAHPWHLSGLASPVDHD